MERKIAYIDCRNGVSGPLVLAALLGANLSMEAIVARLELLPLAGLEIASHAVHVGALSGMSCALRTKEHLSLTDYIERLPALSLDEQVAMRTLAILRRLQAALGAVGSSVSFHAAQALVEVVSVVSALQQVGVEQLYASPLPLTGSALQDEVSLLVVPDPLALEVLRQVRAPWQPISSAGGPVTPVAAALLAELACFKAPVFSMDRALYGFSSAGEEQMGLPLPLYLGTQLLTDSSEESIMGGMETDTVAVIETHIDSMSAELLGALLDRLLEAGALDVGYTPLQMKKNRPGTRLTVICPEESGEHLALLLLRETNTLGVRIQKMSRRKAQRRQERIETPLGPMLVKVKSLAGEIISVSPEYEECLRISRSRSIPLAEVYEVARIAAQRTIIERKEERERY